MKLPVIILTIGAFTFSWANEVKTVSSWKMLTDTTTIKLPKNISFDKKHLAEQIKKGDKVIVQTGYNQRLNTVFTGYVTAVKPTVPLEIVCEDEMWNLKQTNIIKSGKSASLSSLIKEIVPDVSTDLLDVELGNYFINNISQAKFLEKLKADFGLYSFFRGKTLVIGKPYNSATLKKVTFKLGDNIKSDKLVYKRKDEVKVRVKAVSNNKDGSKTTVELGDKNGQSRTLNFYNISKKELKASAEREMKRFNYDGWRGGFVVFGEPFVRHGDIVILEDTEDSDKTGEYYVDELIYTFGVGGVQQEIELGRKA